jgi:hypothetical protein
MPVELSLLGLLLVLLLCVAMLVYVVRRTRSWYGMVGRVGEEWDAEVARRAHERGWSFTGEDNRLLERYRPSSGLHLYRPGHAAPFTSAESLVANVVSGGRRGWPVLAFEYYYVAKGERRYRVVAIPLSVSTPRLEVRSWRRYGTRTLRRIAGTRRLRLGDAEFDRAFLVHTDAPGFARAVLTPDVRRIVDLPVKFEDGEIFTYQELSADPDGHLDLADYLIDILERVPEEAWRHPPPGRTP